jgi:hypothetical protein
MVIAELKKHNHQVMKKFRENSLKQVVKHCGLRSQTY